MPISRYLQMGPVQWARNHQIRLLSQKLAMNNLGLGLHFLHPTVAANSHSVPVRPPHVGHGVTLGGSNKNSTRARTGCTSTKKKKSGPCPDQAIEGPLTNTNVYSFKAHSAPERQMRKKSNCAPRSTTAGRAPPEIFLSRRQWGKTELVGDVRLGGGGSGAGPSPTGRLHVCTGRQVEQVPGIHVKKNLTFLLEGLTRKTQTAETTHAQLAYLRSCCRKGLDGATTRGSTVSPLRENTKKRKRGSLTKPCPATPRAIVRGSHPEEKKTQNIN